MNVKYTEYGDFFNVCIFGSSILVKNETDSADCNLINLSGKIQQIKSCHYKSVSSSCGCKDSNTAVPEICIRLSVSPSEFSYLECTNKVIHYLHIFCSAGHGDTRLLC